MAGTKDIEVAGGVAAGGFAVGTAQSVPVLAGIFAKMAAFSGASKMGFGMGAALAKLTATTSVACPPAAPFIIAGAATTYVIWRLAQENK